ncbi:MAG: pentapeptide repeat-containing protein [Pseudomonadota bacterium]
MPKFRHYTRRKRRYPLEARSGFPSIPKDNIETRLDHIRELSQNARTTWFGLLALLAFVTVTLMAHDDAKFFAAGVETELPLVGISVPTTAFFIAAPLLLAAVYAYLHLYLMALWDALAELPQGKGAPPISERVYSWLLTQAALWLRRVIRKDGAAPRRALGMATALVSFLITWIFGLLALGRLWTESFAYHEEVLTLWIATCLAAAGFIGVRSFFAMWRLMAGTQHALAHSFPPWLMLSTALALPLLAVWSWERTEGGAVIYRAAERNRIVIALFQTAEARNTADDVQDAPPFGEDPAATRRWHALASLSRASLEEAELTIRPTDWRSWANWMEDFEKEYRDRKDLTAAELLEAGNKADFEADAKERYADYIATLEAPNLRDRDLRNARLAQAFIPGADLRSATMQGANLSGAEMQGAACDGATLRGAPSHAATLLCHGLRPQSLEFATGDGRTRLPVGVAVQSCLDAPETTLPDDVKSAFDDYLAASPWVSREHLFELSTCDPATADPLKRSAIPIQGTWKAQEDGSWINTVDMLDGTPAGTVHAEGPDGEWRDIPPKR